MQYVHAHFLEIAQTLKAGYLNDRQKLYRIQNCKTAKKTFEQNCSNILTNELVLSHVRGSGGP